MRENDSPSLPAAMFQRVDESVDSEFYAEPRFVAHIDQATIDALSDFYRTFLPRGCDVLDLMSSWISHLPEDVDYQRVAGLGMNDVELGANPRLTEWVVQDLNASPVLPYEDDSFDAVVNTVSVQYLIRPVATFAEIARVLRPGGISIVAMSHRCFPTKAVRAWHALPPPDRIRVVAAYFSRAGGYEAVRVVDRSPEAADPLWLVIAQRISDPE